jgi:hypothetical protein
VIHDLEPTAFHLFSVRLDRIRPMVAKSEKALLERL